MLSDLPTELHQLVTDYLSPEEFINYKRAFLVQGLKYCGRHFDLQKALKDEIEKIEIVVDRMEDIIIESTFEVNWDLVLLMLKTGRIQNEKYMIRRMGGSYRELSFFHIAMYVIYFKRKAEG